MHICFLSTEKENMRVKSRRYKFLPTCNIIRRIIDVYYFNDAFCYLAYKMTCLKRGEHDFFLIFADNVRAQKSLNIFCRSMLRLLQSAVITRLKCDSITT